MAALALEALASVFLAPDLEVPLPGRTAGRPFPPPGRRVEFENTEALQFPYPEVGAITFVDSSSPISPVAEGAAVFADFASAMFDWFDNAHALPRTEIAFGNVITQSDKTYEVFNAYRKTAITINTAMISVSGMQLPNLSPPDVLSPFTSTIDPLSTVDDPDADVLRALAVGPFTFSGTVTFGMSAGGDLSVSFAGTRIVLLVFDSPESGYEWPLRESMAFRTDIIPSLSGKDRRAALRAEPRQGFLLNMKLDGDDRRRLHPFLLDLTDNTFGLPLFHEEVRLTAAISAGAVAFPVAGADDIDMRIGGLALVFTDAATFDVGTVSTVTDTLITVTDLTVNAYPIGTKVMPLRTVMLRRAVRGSRVPGDLEKFSMVVVSIDNETGAIAGDTTPGFWSTFGGRVLFDDCNVVSGEVREEFERRVHVFDNDTGLVKQATTWDLGKRRHPKSFTLRSRAEIKQFRRLMRGLNGPQKAFWIPTFADDLRPVTGHSIGGATIDVAFIGYTRYVRDRQPMATMRLTYTDGTTTERTVSSSAEVSATVERLTISVTWPANRSLGEIVRIEFFELARFDADEFIIEHERVGLARVKAAVVRSFDDN